MSDVLAKYSFLPWARTGLGNEITETDVLGGNVNSATVLDRPQINVGVKVEASKDGNKDTSLPLIIKPVKIQGPGDVLGINARQVIRVHPRQGVINFETNNLCYVEFYEEDFPWRFTPAKPNNNKLRPWISLIVCKEDEFVRNTQGGPPTPYITIERNALTKIFFNEEDAHYFAHVHVLEPLAAGAQNNAATAATELQAKLAKNPDLALSRIICPRKLEPDTEYFAFLIPGYETGRKAGLGENTAAIKAQASAWIWQNINSANHPDKYPYYYTWSFKTGIDGDFESLATKLVARTLPENVGRRSMDLRNMGYGIEPAGNAANGHIEGAMKHPNYVTPNVPTALKNPIREILNLSANLQAKLPIVPQGQVFYSSNIEIDPIITPPTYGKWHAFVTKLNDANDWVHQLNLHPTHRAAAGLGTRVVQEQQESFMEMAWAQIGAINEANQKIKENELIKRVADFMFHKNVKKLDDFELVNTVGNALGVIKGTNQGFTAQKALKDSRIPTALRSGTFTKIANNFTQTALMNAQGADGANNVLNTNLFKRANTLEPITITDPITLQLKTVPPVSAAPIRANLPVAVSPVLAFQAINAIVSNPPPTFFGRLSNAIAAAGVNFSTANIIAAIPQYVQAEKDRATAILNAILKPVTNPTGGQLDLGIPVAVFEDKVSNQFTEAIYDTNHATIKKVRFFKQASQQGGFIPLVLMYANVLASRVDFQSSFQNTFIQQISPNVFKGKVFLKPTIAALNTENFRDNIINRFNPLFNFRRKIDAYIQADMANKSKPLMAYPRFPFPVYDYLKNISPDYIIPNISDIQPDTITLMEPNQKFIEAFLAGMNHEFSRELLWREFPTDMRGSYFRHFWEYDNDPRQEVFPLEGESEADFNARVIGFQDSRADIKELHNWGNSALGTNQNGPNAGLVLLIKGDLFRKYPGTLVYAQKAKARAGATTSQPPRELTDYNDPTKVKWPIISGSIEPDVYFFGFELTPAEAKGNPGWFFVLRERPGQISFGLDDLQGNLNTPPADWNAVTWQHISGNAQTAPPRLQISGKLINPTNSAGISWLTNSANTAYILYQNPVLFARHASTML
jgi:hypothetical protein